MRIGPYQLSNSLLVAPMAGVTDRPFRVLCKNLGAGYAVSEMMTSQPQLWATQKSKTRMNHDGENAPISVQIAGTEPQQMANAALFNIDHGAQIIDINMGCPAKKVCNKLAGSALLQDEDLVARILDAVVAAVDVPVTLKTRLGFLNGHENILRVAKRAEESGIAALALHGRTREDMYLNTARYDLIKQVKELIDIPLIANGDIDSPEKAKYVLDYTGADAIMIGRAAQGRPWIFREIAHYLKTGEHLAAPDIAEVRTVLLGHLAELYQFYGEYSGCRIARKHIAWYTKGLRSSNEFRQSMYKVENTVDQAKVVEAYFDQLLDLGQRMSDVQVEQVNLLEIK